MDFLNKNNAPSISTSNDLSCGIEDAFLVMRFL